MIISQKKHAAKYNIDTKILIIGIETTLDLHQKSDVEIVLRLSDNKAVSYTHLTLPTN